ncbi:hypothetical protein CRG98_027461 [Punica granatum]|uniref:Uncharacterized protein n=1 Tax=Punica granatum TaxID=22663 RepID=A0A2I0J7D0_PUNGR|nr:hypothetical protein CRG98_027461 [Punica granatum]
MEKKTIIDMDSNGMDEAAIGVAVGPTDREFSRPCMANLVCRCSVNQSSDKVFR